VATDGWGWRRWQIWWHPYAGTSSQVCLTTQTGPRPLELDADRRYAAILQSDEALEAAFRRRLNDDPAAFNSP
jgi:hypothetical protein